MIRGVSRAIKAETEEGVMNIPDKIVVKTIKDRVLETIMNSKDGYTNTELCKTTGIKSRRVREATQYLQMEKLITCKSCRCNHTPIYYPYK
jgi:transcription initiation factor IIE alpha subunit